MIEGLICKQVKVSVLKASKHHRKQRKRKQRSSAKRAPNCKPCPHTGHQKRKRDPPPKLQVKRTCTAETLMSHPASLELETHADDT